MLEQLIKDKLLDTDKVHRVNYSAIAQSIDTNEASLLSCLKAVLH